MSVRSPQEIRLTLIVMGGIVSAKTFEWWWPIGGSRALDLLAASSGLSSLYHWWILWMWQRPPVLACGVTSFAGLLFLCWRTPHKAVQLLSSLLILGMMACGTVALGIWQHQEAQRLVAIPRLGLARETTWEQVEYHLDCELVRLGMERRQVEASLALLGDYWLNDQMESDGNGRIIVGFKEFSLQPRYYYFRDGLLIAKDKLTGGWMDQCQ